MEVVLDASAVLSWLLDEGDRRAKVLALLGHHPLLAPAIWLDAVPNGLVVHERAGRLPPRRRVGMLAQVEALPVQTAPSPGMARIAELAIESGLTTYDAEYLHLALERGASLLTFDRQLACAARGRGVTIL